MRSAVVLGIGAWVDRRERKRKSKIPACASETGRAFLDLESREGTGGLVRWWSYAHKRRR